MGCSNKRLTSPQFTVSMLLTTEYISLIYSRTTRSLYKARDVSARLHFCFTWQDKNKGGCFVVLSLEIVAPRDKDRCTPHSDRVITRRGELRHQRLGFLLCNIYIDIHVVHCYITFWLPRVPQQKIEIIQDNVTTISNYQNQGSSLKLFSRIINASPLGPIPFGDH